MKKKLNRVFLCIHNGKVWENASDIPILLIVKNIDTETIQHVLVPVDSNLIDTEEEIVEMMEEEGMLPSPLLQQKRKKKTNA